MDVKKTLIKSMLPIVRDNLGNINNALAEKIDSIDLIEGEAYAGFVITNYNSNCKVSTCTFTDDDKLSRQVDVENLSDVIENLLTLI